DCLRESGNERYRSSPEHRLKVKLRRGSRRSRVFDAYGKICACCGETTPRLLCLDHIDESGKEHRQLDMLANNLTEWVIRNNFPPGFQMLCYRCNLRKSKNKGVCNCPSAVLKQGIPLI